MFQDFYAKLSEQEKKIFYATIGVVVFAVFDFLFFQPVSSKLKTLDRDIEQTKSDIKRDVRFLAYQDKILKEEEIYRVYKTDEQKKDEEITATFLKTIETLASEAEINLGKLNPGETTPKKGYFQYHANVECSGKLENIVKFVHKVDTTNNLLKVVKMNVVGKKSSADEVTVTMKIAKLIIDTKSAVAGQNAEDADVLKGAGQPSGGTGVQSSDASGNLSSLAAVSGAPSGELSVKEGLGSAAGAGGGAGVGGAGGGGTAGGQKGQPGSPGSPGGAGDRAGQAGDAGAVEGDNGGKGTGGKAPDSKGAKPGQDAKAVVQSNLKKKPKGPIRVDEVNKGERIKVSGLEELWNNFWGIKPKPKVEKAKPEKKSDMWTSEDDESKANFLQRLLNKTPNATAPTGK